MAWSNYTRRLLLGAVAVFAMAVRLIWIDQPFVDNWSWRQSDVAAIARNFFQNGFQFAYPQIDWAGDAAGFVGTEFPVLPFVAALCYEMAGLHEWIGRIQAVLFFAGSLPFFYLLVREIFDEPTAIWALIFYSFAPLSVVASRAFMPDMPSLALALAGLYFFLRYAETARLKFLTVATLIISLALLIKLPTAVVGAPLLYLAVAAAPRRQKIGAATHAGETPPLQNTIVALLMSRDLWVFAAGALIPSAIWYWHAHQIAETHYPFHFFGGGGVRIMAPQWYWKILVQTATSTLTPLLFVLAIVGCFVAPRVKFGRVFHWWLAAMVVFVFVVGWGNRHQWYQLPLVPIVAVFAGCACSYFSRLLVRATLVRRALTLALLLAFVSWSYVYAQPLYTSSAESLRQLGWALKEQTPHGALIVAANNGDPTVFYYAERKGWHFLEKHGVFEGNPLDSAQLITDFEALRARGATYVAFDWSTRWWLDYYTDFAAHLAGNATLIQKTPQFSIYKLEVVRQ
jgi:hypothetical protein